MGGGGAAHDGVVDEHHALALHGGSDGVELDAHAVLPLLLGGLDEGAADVLVFDEADAVGNAALAGVADGGVDAAVGHADDHVGLHGMVQRQERARAQARHVHAAAVHHAVGAGEVDELKNAQGAVAFAGTFEAFDALGGDDHGFARLDVAHEGRAHRVQRAAFAGKDHVAVQIAHAQGVEAVRVARGDELLRAHDHQRIRALDALHGAQHGLLDAVALEPLLRDNISDHLGVAGGVEDRALEFQFFAQLAGVDEVAVMAQGQSTFEVVDEHGLSVAAILGAGGAVAAVTHGHAALVQLFQHVAGKDLVDQTNVLVAVNHAVVVDGDAAALLSAVLQGVKGVVGGGHHAGFSVLEIDAEYAALLVQLVKRMHAHSPIRRFMIS